MCPLKLKKSFSGNIRMAVSSWYQNGWSWHIYLHLSWDAISHSLPCADLISWFNYKFIHLNTLREMDLCFPANWMDYGIFEPHPYHIAEIKGVFNGALMMVRIASLSAIWSLQKYQTGYAVVRSCGSTRYLPVELLFVQFILVQPVFVQSILSNPNLT